MRPPGFPGNPPVRMPRAPTPARSPPPRPLRGGDVAFRPTQDVGPRDQRISGLNPAAYALPVNASRPGSPQAHASLGSGWRPTLAGWDRLPTGFRTRFRRSRHLVPLDRAFPAHALVHESKLARNASNASVRHRLIANDSGRPHSVIRLSTLHASTDSTTCPTAVRARRRSPRIDLYRKKAFSTRAWRWYPASFFHRRRPIFVTVRIVRPRALERGRRRDSRAVLKRFS